MTKNKGRELFAVSRSRLNSPAAVKHFLSNLPKKDSAIKFKAIPVKKGERLADKDGYLACICNYYILDEHLPVVLDSPDTAIDFAKATLAEMHDFKNRKPTSEEYSYPSIDAEMALLDKLSEKE